MSEQPGLTISEQNIDVWLASYGEIVDVPLLASLRMLLSDAERQQETRFHFADDRQRYLVTRAMVRTVLSRYAAVAPADWVFSNNAYGRPEIANALSSALGLGFNVSHSRGVIALAVSRHRALGVDVENLRVRQVSIDIAERFFSPREVAELASVPLERRQDRFFEYWTFKSPTSRPEAWACRFRWTSSVSTTRTSARCESASIPRWVTTRAAGASGSSGRHRSTCWRSVPSAGSAKRRRC